MIRDKIKEIGENIDKFKLRLKVPSRIRYQDIEIANGDTLYINHTEIILSRSEWKYLKKIASKKLEEEQRKNDCEEEKHQENLLNSINFKGEL